MPAAASAPSQRRLAPAMKSIPPRIAKKTRDVPRSGWSMTRTSGGAITRHAPRIEVSESSLRSRSAR